MDTHTPNTQNFRPTAEGRNYLALALGLETNSTDIVVVKVRGGQLARGNRGGNTMKTFLFSSSFLSITIIIVVVNLVSVVNCVNRYTEQSCTDLVPRNQDSHYNDELRLSRSRNRDNYKKKRHDYEGDIPFKINVPGTRYRRNSDLVVQIEGGSFEGLMLQCRIVSGGELLRGGVGLVGQFRYLPATFVYLPCFDIPFATIVDREQPIALGNVTFIWTAPDTEAGDIRFIASVNRGIHYWVIVSKTLQFNPFPISAYGCGTTLACFRVCPYDQNPCGPRESVYVLSHNIDSRDRGEFQFTMGGRLPNNNTYMAVAFGEDFENLIQADMVVCYVERGRIRIEHLLIDSIHTAPYTHNDLIELEDSDLDGNMLWCRFNRRAIYDRRSYYHFYFFGHINHDYPQRFMLPRRSEIYTSSFKRNFTHPINEVISGANIIVTSLYYKQFLILQILAFGIHEYGGSLS